MRRIWILASIFVLVAVITLSATPALAQGGRTAFGEPVTIESGETVEGDVVSFGGPVSVKRDAVVEGDVISWGGPITIAGHIKGDVISWGGPINLQDSAVVGGDVVTVGGPVDRSPEAVVEGEIVSGFDFRGLRPFRFGIPPFSPPSGVPPAVPGVRVDVNGGPGLLGAIFTLFKIGILSVVVAVIALLLLIFIPEQTHTVKQIAMDEPIVSIGVGILTGVVVPALIIALLFTFCGIPISVILGLVLLAALLYGWIAVGVMVGERLLAVLNTERPLPLISGLIGTLLITLVSAVPCLGWLLAFIGGSWGLGAVVLSRGGMRSYPSLPGSRDWRPFSPPPTPVGSAEVVSRAESAGVPEPESPPVAPLVQPAGTTATGLDNLQLIAGIGPVYEWMLREAGIRTYSDLAARDPHELVEIVSGPGVVPASVEAARRWIEEARRLAEA